MRSGVRRVALCAPVVALLALGLGAGPSGVASAAEVSAGSETGPGHAGFGPDLDLDQEDLTTYVDRLGLDVSLGATSVGYPLDPDGVRTLETLSTQTVQTGAAAVLTLEPGRLEDLGPADAARLGDVLARTTSDDGSYVLVRFAPEMNGSWTQWGQQPAAYVDAFRTVARAVHRATDAAAMVWAPAYGAGYPYSQAVNATTSRREADGLVSAADVDVLDTDGNGTVDDADDPYGPYYPGDRAADWVGLTILRYGVSPAFGANTVPGADELGERLAGRFGYRDPDARGSFYRRFARGHDKPMLLVTGAMYNPQRDGADERSIKQEWLDQVIEATDRRPRIRAVQWLEQVRDESEIGNPVRWGLSQPRGVARDTRRTLRDSPLALGPVVPVGGASDAPDTGDGPLDDGSGSDAAAGGDSPFTTPIGDVASSDVLGLPAFLAGVLSTLLVGLVAVVVVLRVRRRRMIPPWLR